MWYPEVFTYGGKSLCCRLPLQLVEEIAANIYILKEKTNHCYWHPAHLISHRHKALPLTAFKDTEYCTAEGEISDNAPPQLTTHSFRILNTSQHKKLWVRFPSIQLKPWLANSSMDRSLNISRSPYIRIDVLQGIHIFETSLQNNAKEDFQCRILVKLSIKSSSCPF